MKYKIIADAKKTKFSTDANIKQAIMKIKKQKNHDKNDLIKI